MSQNPVIQALEEVKNGNWEKAHSIVQDLETREAARIHAYLHRMEGDEFNAGYWYRRAGESVYRGTLEEEWQHLFDSFHQS